MGMKKNDFVEKVEKIKNIFNESPVPVISLIAILITAIFFISLAMGLIPDMDMKDRKHSFVKVKDGNVMWLGMEIVPVTRSIRKEFQIPRNIGGMFVVNEGVGLSQIIGIRTGDTIHSINRRHFDTYRSFKRVADSTPYYDGVLIEVFRDGKNYYMTFPFQYPNGPLMGPNKGHWQLGSPLIDQALPYGSILEDQQENNIFRK